MRRRTSKGKGKKYEETPTTEVSRVLLEASKQCVMESIKNQKDLFSAYSVEKSEDLEALQTGYICRIMGHPKLEKHIVHHNANVFSSIRLMNNDIKEYEQTKKLAVFQASRDKNMKEVCEMEEHIRVIQETREKYATMRQQLLTLINQAKRNFSKNCDSVVKAGGFNYLLQTELVGIAKNKLCIEEYLQGLWDEFVALCGIEQEEIVDEAPDTEDDEAEVEINEPEELVPIIEQDEPKEPVPIIEQDIVAEATVLNVNEAEVEISKPEELVSIIISSIEQNIVDEVPVTEDNEAEVKTAEPKEPVSIITPSTEEDILDEAPVTEDNETKVVTGEPEEPVSIITSSLRSYREAISNNDEAKAAEIEAFLISIEDELKNEVATLSKELSYLRDRVVRISADFNNFQKRLRDRETLPGGQRSGGSGY